MWARVRLATSPKKKGSSSMLAIARRAYFNAKLLNQDLKRYDLFRQASAMAYLTLFSLVPSLAAVFTLISVFRPFLGEQGDLMNKARELILENLVAGSGEQVLKYLENFLANLDLKKIGITSFAGLVVTLLLLLRQIEGALNSIWLVQKERNFLSRFFYFWAFLTLGAFIGSVVIGVTSGFNFHQWFDFTGSVAKTVNAGSHLWSILSSWLGTFAFFFLLYKVVPNTLVTWREATIGAAVGSILFELASGFYGLYIKSFTNYQSVYGALAAVPLFLFWLYVCWIIILFGAVIAWRTREGFPLPQEGENLGELAKAEHHITQTHIRALMPFFLLMEIYRKFADATGQGINCREIHLGLKLPLEWVLESATSLLRMNLVIMSKDPLVSSETDDFGEQRLFPSFPASSVKVADLIKHVTADTAKWMTEWRSELPIDFNKAVNLVASGDAKTLSGSFEEFLQRLQRG